MATTLETAQPTTRKSATARPVATRNGSGSDADALHEVLAALAAAADGDFSVRLATRRATIVGEIAARYNELVELDARMAKEAARGRRVLGPAGPDDRSRGPAP